MISKTKIVALICVALAGASSIEASMFAKRIGRLGSMAGESFQSFKRRFKGKVADEKEYFNRDRRSYFFDKGDFFFEAGFYVGAVGLAGSVATMPTPLSTRTPLGDKVHKCAKNTLKLGGGLFYITALCMSPVPTTLATAIAAGGVGVYKYDAARSKQQTS